MCGLGARCELKPCRRQKPGVIHQVSNRAHLGLGDFSVIKKKIASKLFLFLIVNFYQFLVLSPFFFDKIYIFILYPIGY